MKRRCNVSVPLRGLWFLSIVETRGVILVSRSFRPLAGIMVLIISVYQGYTERERTFPSPCGDYGSYLDGVLVCTLTTAYRVSVPLRGLWFLSAHDRGNDEGQLGCSFRPLAGIMVLIFRQALPLPTPGGMFPSPCGDYGSYRLSSVRNG